MAVVTVTVKRIGSVAYQMVEIDKQRTPFEDFALDLTVSPGGSGKDDHARLLADYMIAGWISKRDYITNLGNIGGS